MYNLSFILLIGSTFILPYSTIINLHMVIGLVGDFYCIFVTFPCGNLGQVWYLIVSFESFPDLCHLSYLDEQKNSA